MLDALKIRAQIERAASAEMNLPPEIARDVALHMTDCLEDLHRFVKFCEDPASFSMKEIGDALLSLLLHTPNHMAAAAKLYAGVAVSDVFEVGAVMVREDWREMAPRERALLNHLLQVDFAGRDELVAQSKSAQVVRVDAEGSLRFRVESPRASVAERVPIEGWYHDGDAEEGQWRPAVHMLLHVIDGRLHELEIYKDDSATIIVSPFEIPLGAISVSHRQSLSPIHREH